MPEALSPAAPGDVRPAGDPLAIRVVRDGFFRSGDEELATMPVPDLLARLGLEPAAVRFSPMVLAYEVGPRLDRIGIAFEPDRRYGPHGLAAEGAAVLFRFPNGAPIDPHRSAYAVARAQVEAAIRAGDSNVSQFEPIGVSARVLARLAAAERTRLRAYGLALFLKSRRRS
jgi:hypothetical protein